MSSVFIHPPPSPQEFTRRLSEILDFTIRDLMTNREGKITGRQWRRMIWRATHPLLKGMLAALVLFLLMVMMQNLLGYGALLWTVWGLCLLTLIIGFSRSLVQSGKLLFDLCRGQVVWDEGKLKPSWRELKDKRLVNDAETGSRTVREFQLQVAGRSFPLEEAVWRAMTEQYEKTTPTARVYFTAVSQQILSVEVTHVDEFDPTRRRAPQKPVSIWK
jgi:hypothetical protein